MVVIKSFSCKTTEAIWNKKTPRKFPPSIFRRAYRKLKILAAAESLDDLKSPPGNRLEALKGDRKGQYSIRINTQFRICFIWDGQNVHDVEIVDYH